jgi:prevent-host-death family protein
MKHAVSAAEANRGFSEVLRQVRQGRTVVVTAHGRPVARIVPIAAGDRVVTTARAALFKRLKAARPAAIGRWTRDELYEDAP